MSLPFVRSTPQVGGDINLMDNPSLAAPLPPTFASLTVHGSVWIHGSFGLDMKGAGSYNFNNEFYRQWQLNGTGGVRMIYQHPDDLYFDYDNPHLSPEYKYNDESILVNTLRHD